MEYKSKAIKLKKWSKDITGYRSGKLVAIKPVGRNNAGSILWECKCDCGTVKNIASTDIFKQYITSCGCRTGGALDLEGQQFGQLVVVRYSHHRKTRRVWECKCSCGNNHTATTGDLRSGHVYRCGECSNSFRIYANRSDALLRIQHNRIKQRHRRLGHKTQPISFQDFKDVVLQPCCYCGLPFSKEYKDKNVSNNKLISNEILKCNGLDRKNSKLGYTKRNVVSCCITCNTIKSDMHNQDWQEWIKRFIKHQIELGILNE